MAQRNQHKPLPPEEELYPRIKHYWSLGYGDPKIASHTLDHFDREKYGLSAKSVQRIRVILGLKGTRQQKQELTQEQWHKIYSEARHRYPNMGARGMVTYARRFHSVKVSEKFVNECFHLWEKNRVLARKQKRFRRKQFIAAGVMEVITVDQHDKWKRFGLYGHVGLDPFSGRICWLKIWWTNRNPILVTSYYLEAARKILGIPLATQSDPGSENYGIANCHTGLRHLLDPSLAGTLQHRWMNSKKNVKPEALWSDWRRNGTPGFEEMLDEGVNCEPKLYDYNDPLERLIFRWLAVPYLQYEADIWMQTRNETKKRADKHKLLPQGEPPVIIHAKPERFGARNFMISVTPQILDEAEQKWAPPDHPVFQLTPPDFHNQASQFYEEIGKPPVGRDTFWDIYRQLLFKFEQAAVPDSIKKSWQAADDHAFEAQVALVEGQEPLVNHVRQTGDDENLFESGSDNGRDGLVSSSEYGSFSDSLSEYSFSDDEEEEEEVAGMVTGMPGDVM